MRRSFLKVVGADEDDEEEDEEVVRKGQQEPPPWTIFFRTSLLRPKESSAMIRSCTIVPL